jgi:hypothetical protein
VKSEIAVTMTPASKACLLIIIRHLKGIIAALEEYISSSD